jgi:hypothetical protein
VYVECAVHSDGGDSSSEKGVSGMSKVDEILADLERQLQWRGPTDKSQGIIVMERDDVQYLVTWIKSISSHGQQR